MHDHTTAELADAIITAHRNGGITPELVAATWQTIDIVTLAETINTTNPDAYKALTEARRNQPPTTTWDTETHRINTAADPETVRTFQQWADEVLQRLDTPPTPEWVEWLDPSLIRFDNEFWTADDGHDWLVEPLIPAARQTAIVSAPKTGKSLVMLETAAALATGRPVLERPASTPVDVMYLDLEMTPTDLRERLTDLGYGPDTNLQHLHYYSLPSLPPLDTPTGGIAITQLADHHNAALVIIDTTSRVIDGEENSADTFANLYRYCGLPLKAAGRALVRLDHHGKDPTKGARGSSAKNADLDLVWSLTANDAGGVTFTRTHQRIAWAPDRVELARADTPLRHTITGDAWPAGTADTAAALDHLGVPLDATRRQAQIALAESGQGRRTAVVTAALKHRRQAAAATIDKAVDNPGDNPVDNPVDNSGTTPGTNISGTAGNQHGNQHQNPRKTGREPAGNHAEPPSPGETGTGVVTIREPPRDTPTETADPDGADDPLDDPDDYPF